MYVWEGSTVNPTGSLSNRAGNGVRMKKATAELNTPWFTPSQFVLPLGGDAL